MSAPDIGLVRQRLADNCATADTEWGMVYSFTPDQIADVPAVVVDTPDFEALAFGRSTWMVKVPVHLIIGATWDETTQAQLDRMMPDLFDALESDRTLGGLGSMAVQSVRSIKRVDVADVGYAGAMFDVEVVVS